MYHSVVVLIFEALPLEKLILFVASVISSASCINDKLHITCHDIGMLACSSGHLNM